jgi:hypothetical protein
MNLFVLYTFIIYSYNRFESNRNVPTYYLILNLTQGACDILRGQPTCQTSSCVHLPDRYHTNTILLRCIHHPPTPT